uniref:RING-CH-type domain-containing protein n=1 Tax=Panagrellus redivivus TaxID=6233 RepID=A0A7E4WAD5_PANRE
MPDEMSGISVISIEEVPSTSTEVEIRTGLKEKLLRTMRSKSRNTLPQPSNPLIREKPSPSSKRGPIIEETFYAPDSDKKCLLVPFDTDGRCPDGNDPRKKQNLQRHCSLPSIASSSSDTQCRICHSGVNTSDNPLIAPCRCNGSLKFVHTSCLVRWLEISSDKFWPTKQCELCAYRFKRHSLWKLRKLHWPVVSTEDRVLNVIFVCLLLMMITCIIIACYFPSVTRDSKYSSNHYIRFGDAFFRRDEITTAIAGVFFLISFLLALCTQYRAGGTVFRQLFRIWAINRNWLIRDYDPDDDAELNRSRSHATVTDPTVVEIDASPAVLII